MDPAEDGTTRSLLTPDEEHALALRIEAGVLAADALAEGRCPVGATAAELEQLVVEGEAARNRFTEANLGLAGMVTRHLALRSGGNSAEIFQEACVGLLVAVMRFDCRRGFRFATYALFWVRAYAGATAARTHGDQNLPTSRATQLRTLRGVEAALEQSLGRSASPRDVAEVVGRPESWVAEVLAHAPPLSLAELDPDEHRWFPASPELAPSVEVSALLRELPQEQRTVLELRLGFATGEPLSYTTVSDRLEVSVSRVRRMERKALERLRAVCPYDDANLAP